MVEILKAWEKDIRNDERIKVLVKLYKEKLLYASDVEEIFHISPKEFIAKVKQLTNGSDTNDFAHEDNYTPDEGDDISDREMDRRFAEAVRSEIRKKKLLGLPIARYDEKNELAYIEYPDGRREYCQKSYELSENDFENEIPNADTIAAILEVEAMANDPNVKIYDSIGELFKDLNAPEDIL